MTIVISCYNMLEQEHVSLLVNPQPDSTLWPHQSQPETPAEAASASANGPACALYWTLTFSCCSDILVLLLAGKCLHSIRYSGFVNETVIISTAVTSTVLTVFQVFSVLFTHEPPSEPVPGT